MTGESTEAQLARQDERLKRILEELVAARDSRKYQYESIEKLGRSLASIEGRVENVENSLAITKPTIDEFIIIKHKVLGAGMFGRWVWAAAASVVTLLFSMREQIIVWLSK